MDQNQLKQAAAHAAIAFIEPEMIVGVGTGSTVNFFIAELAKIRQKIEGAVASSEATAKLLKQHNIPVLDLNATAPLPIYVDGCDEINDRLQMIKGGGGALTREKIIATASSKFICIADASKKVSMLGQFPIAIEVLPIARSFVARELVKLGGEPVYREAFLTDNGNIILDVYNMKLIEPLKIEREIKHIPGVVENGIFAARMADCLLLASDQGVAKVMRK